MLVSMAMKFPPCTPLLFFGQLETLFSVLTFMCNCLHFRGEGILQSFCLLLLHWNISYCGHQYSPFCQINDQFSDLGYFSEAFDRSSSIFFSRFLGAHSFPASLEASVSLAGPFCCQTCKRWHAQGSGLGLFLNWNFPLEDLSHLHCFKHLYAVTPTSVSLA